MIHSNSEASSTSSPLKRHSQKRPGIEKIKVQQCESVKMKGLGAQNPDNVINTLLSLQYLRSRRIHRKKLFEFLSPSFGCHWMQLESRVACAKNTPVRLCGKNDKTVGGLHMPPFARHRKAALTQNHIRPSTRPTPRPPQGLTAPHRCCKNHADCHWVCTHSIILLLWFCGRMRTGMPGFTTRWVSCR